RGLLDLDEDLHTNIVNHWVIVADFHPIGTAITVELPIVGKWRVIDTVEPMLALRTWDDAAMQPVVIQALVCHSPPLLGLALNSRVSIHSPTSEVRHYPTQARAHVRGWCSLA